MGQLKAGFESCRLNYVFPYKDDKNREAIEEQVRGIVAEIETHDDVVKVELNLHYGYVAVYLGPYSDGPLNIQTIIDIDQWIQALFENIGEITWQR